MKNRQVKTVKANPVPLKKAAFPKLSMIWPFLIGIIAFALYANTITHEYVLDDSGAITNNLFVQKGFAGIPELLTVDLWHFDNVTLGYYRPLSLISFAVEYEFFGPNPHVSHFNNVMLFALTGFVLCLFLLKLFPKLHPAFSFLAALLYVAHPIHTEVVANIKSRDELLSFFNLLLSLLLIFQHAASKKRSHLLTGLFLFYLALLSKETAITGILILPVCFYFFRENSIPEAVKKALPFIGIAAFFLLQKYMLMGTLTGTPPDDIVNYPYEKQEGVKFPTTMLIFAHCLRLLVWPHPLIYDYSYNQIPAVSWASPGALLGLVLFAGLVWITVKETQKRTVWGFGLLFFFITLIPALAFVLLRGGILAERFLFAPSLGFCIILSYLLILFFNKSALVQPVSMNTWFKGNGKIIIPFTLVFILYSFKTVSRNPVWADNFTLFTTDLKNAGRSCQVYRHVGSEYINKAITEKDTLRKMSYFYKGIDALRKAVRIHPKFGDAYFKIGVAYQTVSINTDSAIYYYTKAIQTAPGYAISYNNLGILYQNLGKNELASYYYNKAIEMNPRFPDALKNAEALKKATGLDVRIMPHVPMQDTLTAIKNDQFYYNQGNYYASRGDYHNAIKNFQKAIDLNPNYEEAYVNMGNSYGMLKDYTHAVEAFNKILGFNSKNIQAYINLAITYQLMGKADLAASYREKARELEKARN